MDRTRKVSRRSMLRQVVGGAVAGSAIVLITGGAARAQPSGRYTGVTDCDSGSGGDAPGYGDGVRNQHTDSDTGPSGDPRCQGRGTTSGSPSGTTYSQPRTGCSDSDYGQNGDPSGHGTRCRGGTNPSAPSVSGCTDRDPGDSIGNGRNCTPP
jgi:hypothetical protein